MFLCNIAFLEAIASDDVVSCINLPVFSLRNILFLCTVAFLDAVASDDVVSLMPGRVVAGVFSRNSINNVAPIVNLCYSRVVTGSFSFVSFLCVCHICRGSFSFVALVCVSRFSGLPPVRFHLFRFYECVVTFFSGCNRFVFICLAFMCVCVCHVFFSGCYGFAFTFAKLLHRVTENLVVAENPVDFEV